MNTEIHCDYCNKEIRGNFYETYGGTICMECLSMDTEWEVEDWSDISGQEKEEDV